MTIFENALINYEIFESIITERRKNLLKAPQHPHAVV